MSHDPKAVPSELRAFFEAHPHVALAFSGGVDSAYLLYAAKACGVDVHAYFVKTPFQPEFERRDALRLAEDLAAQLTLLPYDVLADKVVASNPPDRCYHCKRALFSMLLAQAKKDGYPALMDGTNASDSADDRPGMRALAELTVLSPLRLCGLTKARIRSLSREAGLSTWDKPAYACLATRVPAGTPYTSAMLSAVECAEETLFSLGFSDFRVRLYHGAARIQVPEAQLARLVENRQAIVSALSANFDAVLLDLLPRQGEPNG